MRPDGCHCRSRTQARFDGGIAPQDETDYYRNGGILQYVLRNLMK